MAGRNFDVIAICSRSRFRLLKIKDARRRIGHSRVALGTSSAARAGERMTSQSKAMKMRGGVAMS
jgi:hypothetical protein